MSGKTPVYRLTQEAYDQLWLMAMERPENYLDPKRDFGKALGDRGFPSYLEETGLFSDGPIELKPVESGPSNRADAQALRFYRSLEGMTPRLALDERLWAWMTHFPLHAYGIKCWSRSKTTNLLNYVQGRTGFTADLPTPSGDTIPHRALGGWDTRQQRRQRGLLAPSGQRPRQRRSPTLRSSIICRCTTISLGSP